MILDFLPPWLANTLILAAFLLGGTSPLWLFLQRKDANRKLVVEEGSLDVSQFDALTKTYQDLLTRANNATAAAVAEVEKSQKAREDMQAEFEELRASQHQLRDLFRRVVARSNITLTPDEQREFDATKPRPRRRIRPV